MFADLEIVSNRIGKLAGPAQEAAARQAEGAGSAGTGPAGAHRHGVRAEASPDTLGLKEEEEKAIRSFQLLTLKPELVLLNIGEDRLEPAVAGRPAGPGAEGHPGPGPLELELEDLPEEDREVFVKEFLGERRGRD